MGYHSQKAITRNSKVLEVKYAGGDAFEHSNLAAHTFNEATGNAMMEEIDN